MENQTDESQVSSSDEVKLSYDIVFKQRLRQILAENRIWASTCARLYGISVC